MLVVGPYTLRSIASGSFALDGGAMFGVVPRPLWEKDNPPDEKNRIALALRLLLVSGKERTFLVDAGIGDKFPAKENAIYRVDALLPDEALRRAGVDPDSVTDVLLTHFHFDHAGGATRADGTPTFPRARYHVQRRHLEYAQRPHAKDRASFRPDDFLPLLRGGRLALHDGVAEVAPGVEVLPVDGHTEAMQLVKVSDGSTTLLYCADLAPTVAHLRLPYVMAYDNQPLKTIEEKSALWTRAADGGWILFFEHDPGRAACRLVRGSKDYAEGAEVDL
ncbi:MAG: MBL fold metallo-hydrolase [Planctomycetota bacterium]